MTHAIVATARNEGPFLVEWIAHHLSLGFSAIFIATNDCDDGTDELLDAIGAAWPVHRISNVRPFDPGLTPHRSAMRRCLADPRISTFDWLLHIDLDEFVNFAEPTRTIEEFLAPYRGADAVMLCWRLFGNDGRQFWDGGSVVDGFLSCQAAPDFIGHKVLFRREAFGEIAPHSPKAPLRPLVETRIVTTGNQPVNLDYLPRPRRTALKIETDQLTWQGGWVNHYVHKSHDLTQFNQQNRGAANGRKGAHSRREVGSAAYNLMNRNDVIETSIRRFRAGRLKVEAQILSDQSVLRAHYGAHNWFKAQLLALRSDADAPAPVAANV